MSARVLPFASPRSLSSQSDTAARRLSSQPTPPAALASGTQTPALTCPSPVADRSRNQPSYREIMALDAVGIILPASVAHPDEDEADTFEPIGLASARVVDRVFSIRDTPLAIDLPDEHEIDWTNIPRADIAPPRWFGLGIAAIIGLAALGVCFLLAAIAGGMGIGAAVLMATR